MKCEVCRRELPCYRRFNTHYSCLGRVLDFIEKTYGIEKDTLNFNYFEYIEIYEEHLETEKYIAKELWKLKNKTK